MNPWILLLKAILVLNSLVYLALSSSAIYLMLYLGDSSDWMFIHENVSDMSTLGTLLVAFGTNCFSLSLIGLLGFCLGLRPILSKILHAFILILWIGTVVGLTLGFHYHEQWSGQVLFVLRDGMNHFEDSKYHAFITQKIQSLFQCCGVDAPVDYPIMGQYDYPTSCCGRYDFTESRPDFQCYRHEVIFDQGCKHIWLLRPLYHIPQILYPTIGLVLLQVALFVGSYFVATRRNLAGANLNEYSLEQVRTAA